MTEKKADARISDYDFFSSNKKMQTVKAG